VNAEIFTTVDIAHLTGFSVRQIDYWAHQGLVVPSLQQSAGPGTRRLYTGGDLVQFHFIRQLKQGGWSTQKVRTAVTRLREVMEDPHPLRTAVLFDGKNTLLALCKTKDGERILFDALSAQGQRVMSIVLSSLVEQARQVYSEDWQERRVTEPATP